MTGAPPSPGTPRAGLNMISKAILDSVLVKEKMVADPAVMNSIFQAANRIVEAFRAAGGFFVAGNGGSAADAQHMAAELTGRFYYDRPPLRAEAICTNSSDLTCIGNDYGYEQVFSRAIKGKGRKGDVFMGISTSGNSPNIISAMQMARSMALTTIGLTGESGGKLTGCSDILIKIPTACIPRIQECHIVVIHAICEFVEKELFPA